MNLQSLQINPSGFNVLAEMQNLLTDLAGRWEGQKGRRKMAKKKSFISLLVKIQGICNIQRHIFGPRDTFPFNCVLDEMSKGHLDDLEYW